MLLRRARGRAGAARTSSTYVGVEQLCFHGRRCACSRKRLLDPAACRRSSKVRLLAEKSRSRCLREAFSAGAAGRRRCRAGAGYIAELAEQLAHASALGADLGAGSLERLLGVQRPPLPGRLGLGVAAGLFVPPPGVGAGDGGADQVAGWPSAAMARCRHQRARYQEDLSDLSPVQAEQALDHRSAEVEEACPSAAALRSGRAWRHPGASEKQECLVAEHDPGRVPASAAWTAVVASRRRSMRSRLSTHLTAMPRCLAAPTSIPSVVPGPSTSRSPRAGAVERRHDRKVYRDRVPRTGWEVTVLQAAYGEHAEAWDRFLASWGSTSPGSSRPDGRSRRRSPIGDRDPARRRMLDLLLASGVATATSLS